MKEEVTAKNELIQSIVHLVDVLLKTMTNTSVATEEDISFAKAKVRECSESVHALETAKAKKRSLPDSEMESSEQPENKRPALEREALQESSV
jgi:hypothetical protein